MCARTITNPVTNSALASSTMRSELQLLENEIAHTSSGHDHDGTDSKKIPAINSTHFASLSGASITGILESNITDANVLARVAGNETITGTWSFSNTITNLGLITPKITTSINDVNGNEIISIGTTPSAVNQVLIANAITGTGAIITTAGETNVDLFIRAKGSGSVRLGNADLIFPNADGNAGYALKTDGAGTIGYDILNPMTTAEDIIVGGASGAKTRLAVGDNEQVLSVSGGSVAWVAAAAITKFGGDGSDGALAIDEGTTTINLEGSPVVILNYSSISITNTAKLTFENAHANGTVVVLKSEGAVIMTSSSPSVDMSGIGAPRGSNGTEIVDLDDHFGENGGSGGTAGTGGPILTETNWYIKKATTLYRKTIFLACGSGGGRGGNGLGGSAGVGGEGGNGGGALLIECAGDLTFSGSISVTGANGSNGTNASGGASSGGGGGGGGTGGMCLILYETETAISGTIDTDGGTGGTGGNGQAGGDAIGGKGGGGGGSYYGIGGAGGSGGQFGNGTVGSVGTEDSAGGGGGGGGGDDGSGVAGGAGGGSDNLLIAENNDIA